MKTLPLERQFRLWTILLVVIPSFLIMAIYTVAQISLAKQENLELISQRVAIQEQLIDFWIMERTDDVRGLSQSEAIQSLDGERMKRALLAAQKSNKNFDSLSYIDKNGVFVISTLAENQYPAVIAQPYFLAAQEGKTYISDVFVDQNRGAEMIAFSSPVYDNGGNFQGMILGL